MHKIIKITIIILCRYLINYVIINNYLSDNELIDISKNREGTKIILEKIFEYLKHNTNKRYMHVIEVIMNSILEIQD